VLTLGTMRFAAAAEGSTETHTISGHLPTGAADFVYLPVEVPKGVKQIDVSYTYDKRIPARGRFGHRDLADDLVAGSVRPGRGAASVPGRFARQRQYGRSRFAILEYGGDDESDFSWS
jgi:hypothetical protein